MKHIIKLKSRIVHVVSTRSVQNMFSHRRFIKKVFTTFKNKQKSPVTNHEKDDPGITEYKKGLPEEYREAEMNQKYTMNLWPARLDRFTVASGQAE